MMTPADTGSSASAVGMWSAAMTSSEAVSPSFGTDGGDRAGGRSKHGWVGRVSERRLSQAVPLMCHMRTVIAVETNC